MPAHSAAYTPSSWGSSSMPMTAAAIGVLAAAARTETKPNAAMTPGSSPAAWARATPLVAPMKKSGVTMPPLPPVSRVTAGRHDLEQERQRDHPRGALERGLDRRDAEARVLLPGGEVEERERHPARDRDEVRVAFEAAQEPLEPPHALDQHEGDQAEDGPEQDRQRHDRPVSQERQVLVEDGNGALVPQTRWATIPATRQGNSTGYSMRPR